MKNALRSSAKPAVEVRLSQSVYRDRDDDDNEDALAAAVFVMKPTMKMPLMVVAV